MLLIGCGINLIQTWFVNCVISNDTVNQAAPFAINYTKGYVKVVTLSTQDNSNYYKDWNQD